VSPGGDDRRPGEDRCTTADGLGIAVYDFGGHGDDVLLVHATGFCAEVFRLLATKLGDRFHCWALDLRAHGRSDRPADGDFAWSGFRIDVLTVIDYLGLRRPFAFGHSCGGAAVLLAEQARPGTFRALYCFEPVVLPRTGGLVVEHNPLSEGARRRRETFLSPEDAFINFSSKPPFADLDPEVLELYVESGFELLPAAEGGDGKAIRLRCRRDDEAEIYAHGPEHGAFEHLKEIGCPVTLACGEHTDAFGPAFLRADAEQLPRAAIEVIPAVGHFGPLQQPGSVATSVLRAFDTDCDTPQS
jgi:pimeloyl-ACP methyl ester carboxylesterase